MRLTHQELGILEQSHLRHNMSDYLKVEGYNNLVRDTKSNAIINTDRSAYQMAKKRAADAQRQRDEIRNASREINNIKCEMHEIKSMLKTLLDKD